MCGSGVRDTPLLARFLFVSEQDLKARSGVLGSRVCARLVGVENTVVEAMDFDEVSGDLVVRVKSIRQRRPRAACARTLF